MSWWDSSMADSNNSTPGNPGRTKSRAPDHFCIRNRRFPRWFGVAGTPPDHNFLQSNENEAALAVPVVGQSEIAGQRPAPTLRPKSAEAQDRIVRHRVEKPELCLSTKSRGDSISGRSVEAVDHRFRGTPPKSSRSGE